MEKGSVVLQLKSKRKPKATFQPHVWTHTHANKKNQNKGLEIRNALKVIRTHRWVRFR